MNRHFAALSPLYALAVAAAAGISVPVARDGVWINFIAGPAFPLLAALMLRNRGRDPARPRHQDRLAWLFLGFGVLCAATIVLYIFVVYGLRHVGLHLVVDRGSRWPAAGPALVPGR